MIDHSPSSILRVFHSWAAVRALVIFALLFLQTGCVHTILDPEYFQKLAATRTDCTGKEIVGVWVGQYVMVQSVFKETLLLRADGTGLTRAAYVADPTKADHPTWWFKNVTWKYEGGGTWQVETRSREHPSASPQMATVRYNGRDLLWDSGSGFRYLLVYVPAGDESAVEEYLSTRKSNFWSESLSPIDR